MQAYNTLDWMEFRRTGEYGLAVCGFQTVLSVTSGDDLRQRRAMTPPSRSCWFGSIRTLGESGSLARLPYHRQLGTIAHAIRLGCHR